MPQIHVRKLTGDAITVDVDLSNDTVADLTTKIWFCEGIPQEQFRLLFAGKQLEETRTLSQYGIMEGDTLHLVMRLTGMISTFSSDDLEDPLVEYLMLTDEERDAKEAGLPIQELRNKAAQEGAIPFYTFYYDADCQILQETQLDLLCQFLDYMWKETSLNAPNDRVDMRLSMPGEEFVQVLALLDYIMGDEEYRAKKVLKRLELIYCHVSGASRAPSKIALRMTRGPTRNCIAFHCDGGYATSTSQIPLNCPSEYEGGRLCFFVNGTLHMIPRVAGSLTQHPPKVLHGVTSVTKGTRKSLFVVDKANGLGEDGVIVVTKEHVSSFLTSQSHLTNDRKRKSR